MACATVETAAKAAHLGFDSSEFAVRNMASQVPRSRTTRTSATSPSCALVRLDLLVCSGVDVLHYLPTREPQRGLPGLAELCGGVAFLESHAEDEFEGDHVGFSLVLQPGTSAASWPRACARWVRIAGWDPLWQTSWPH